MIRKKNRRRGRGGTIEETEREEETSRVERDGRRSPRFP